MLVLGWPVMGVQGLNVLLHDQFNIASSASAYLPCKAGRDTGGDQVHAQGSN